MSFYQHFGKRAMDLSLAVPALVVLAPVGVAIGVVARRRLGQPVLFRQKRPGRGDQLVRADQVPDHDRLSATRRRAAPR